MQLISQHIYLKLLPSFLKPYRPCLLIWLQNFSLWRNIRFFNRILAYDDHLRAIVLVQSGAHRLLRVMNVTGETVSPD